MVSKKVYISVDMEGIGGISEAISFRRADLNTDDRELMAEDTNAAIRRRPRYMAPPKSWSTTHMADNATCCRRTCTLDPTNQLPSSATA